jgi:hypothetical protein
MSSTTKLLLLKFAGGMRFALLGHTLGWWMRSIGFSLGSVTLVGTIFGIPFALKPLIYSALNTRCVIDYTLIRRIAMIEYTMLTLTGMLAPGTAGFFCSAGCAGVCGAVFDAVLIGQVRRTTKESDLPYVNRNASVVEVFGMTIGSTGTFYLSQFVDWQGVYRIMIIVATCAMATSISYLRDLQPSDTRILTAGAEFFTRLRTTGYWLIGTILLYRLQSASLAQTLQLFLLDSKLSTNDITSIKLIGYLGTYFAYALAPRCTSHPIPILFLKTLAILGFAYFAATDVLQSAAYACLIAGGTLAIEKFARATDQLMLKEFGLLYSDKQHATIQITTLDSLGMMGRATGEIVSGSLAEYLGWNYFFLATTAPGILLFALLTLRPRSTYSAYVKIDSERT